MFLGDITSHMYLVVLNNPFSEISSASESALKTSEEGLKSTPQTTTIDMVAHEALGAKKEHSESVHVQKPTVPTSVTLLNDPPSTDWDYVFPQTQVPTTQKNQTEIHEFPHLTRSPVAPQELAPLEKSAIVVNLLANGCFSFHKHRPFYTPYSQRIPLPSIRFWTEGQHHFNTLHFQPVVSKDNPFTPLLSGNALERFPVNCHKILLPFTLQKPNITTLADWIHVFLDSFLDNYPRAFRYTVNLYNAPGHVCIFSYPTDGVCGQGTITPFIDLNISPETTNRALPAFAIVGFAANGLWGGTATYTCANSMQSALPLNLINMSMGDKGGIPFLGIPKIEEDVAWNHAIFAVVPLLSEPSHDPACVLPCTPATGPTERSVFNPHHTCAEAIEEESAAQHELLLRHRIAQTPLILYIHGISQIPTAGKPIEQEVADLRRRCDRGLTILSNLALSEQR